MKRLLIAVVLIPTILLTGCTSFGDSLVRTQTGWTGGDYRVTLYSGGQSIREWQIKNAIVNEEEGSDGWYFSCGHELVQLSGDVVVEPLTTSKSSVDSPMICN